MKQPFCAFIGGVLLVGCGTPGRPSGLPAPEYEVPHVAPWPPPSSASAAAPAAPTPPPVGVEPALEEPAGPPQNAGGSGATLPPGNP
jgi:hypothetical protein